MAKSKPNKPYPSFPLTAHPNGQWCKKIRGIIHFFGVWADPDAALKNYHVLAGNFHEGRQPRLSMVAGRGLTIKDVCNHYLKWQMEKWQSGIIGARTFSDCKQILTDFAEAWEEDHSFEHQSRLRSLVGRIRR